MPSILLALDHDEAGVKAVREWRRKLPHKARRVLLPSGKDLTDFHRAGGEVRAWVPAILDRATVGNEPPPSPRDSRQNVAGWPHAHWSAWRARSAELAVPGGDR